MTQLLIQFTLDDMEVSNIQVADIFNPDSVIASINYIADDGSYRHAKAMEYLLNRVRAAIREWMEKDI